MCAEDWRPLGLQNVYLGNLAGKLNSDGNYNVFIGECAGCCTDSNTSRDVVIGYTAGKYLSGALDSVIIGACAAASASSSGGDSSVFVG